MRRGTYSIVAHDPKTGECGVAVQSHWFSVGSVVTWGRAGVGAVATQSIADPAYGPRLLDALAKGEEPQDAMQRLTTADEQGRFRQVACVRADGAVAVHTGDGCIPFAGHRTGAGFSAQANMMATERVWGAMADAFEASEGTLPRRLVAALDAAEAAGGDARGRQSAALLVVPSDGDDWDRVELRVEDDPEPLEELARLLGVHEAYELATEGDDLTGRGLHDEAGAGTRRPPSFSPPTTSSCSGPGLPRLRQATWRPRSSVCAGRSSFSPAGRSSSAGSARRSRPVPPPSRPPPSARPASSWDTARRGPTGPARCR
jgi:uncharacterized Ntn-hydrolase superfamily protein